MSKPQSSKTFGWAWLIATPIVSLFISVFLSLFPLLDFYVRFVIVLIVIGLWFMLLFTAYLLDIQKSRVELLKEICQSDSFVKKWKYAVAINPDGSASVHREIHGLNLAEKRQFFEFESWVDPQRDPVAEDSIKKDAAMTVDVVVTPHRKSPIRIFSSQEIIPFDGHRALRFIRSIPLVDPPSKLLTYLKPQDEFLISLKSSSPAGTWKQGGDRYMHRVTHPTELLHVEIALPRNWGFPRETTSNAVGYVKGSTTGVWEPTEEQPKMTSGNKLVWEVGYPRLMYHYKLEYSKMVNRS